MKCLMAFNLTGTRRRILWVGIQRSIDIAKLGIDIMKILPQQVEMMFYDRVER